MALRPLVTVKELGRMAVKCEGGVEVVVNGEELRQVVLDPRDTDTSGHLSVERGDVGVAEWVIAQFLIVERIDPGRPGLREPALSEREEWFEALRSVVEGGRLGEDVSLARGEAVEFGIVVRIDDGFEVLAKEIARWIVERALERIERMLGGYRRGRGLASVDH